MSASFLPRGSQFGRSTDGTAYVTIAEAKKIDFSIKGDFTDVSNMDSPSVYKEWLPTMIDGGTVKVDLNFINTDATQNALWTDLSGQTDLFWKVQLPNARGKFTFNGFVEALDPSFDVEKPASMTLSVKITGLLTWTPNV